MIFEFLKDKSDQKVPGLSNNSMKCQNFDISDNFQTTLPKDIRSESCLRKEMKAIDHIVSLHSYEIQVDYMDTSNQRRYSSIADCCTRPNFKMANFLSNSPTVCLFVCLNLGSTSYS